MKEMVSPSLREVVFEYGIDVRQDYTRSYFLKLAHVTRFADYPNGFQESVQQHVKDCLVSARNLCQSYAFMPHQAERLMRTLYIHDMVECVGEKDISAPVHEANSSLALVKKQQETEWARGNFNHVDYILYDQFVGANAWFKRKDRLYRAISDQAIVAAVIDKTTGNKTFHTNFVNVWNLGKLHEHQMPAGSLDYTFRQYDAWMSRLRDAGNRRIAGVCAQLLVEEMDYVTDVWKRSVKKPPQVILNRIVK